MENKSTVPNLDTDGVSGTFFDILWAKDELNFGPDVNVPDTIVFRSGQPNAWFFTAKNGKLKKKSRQNMVLAKVEQSFMKHSLGYDIIATFVTISDDKEASSVVQFLDQKSFFDFLYDHSKTCSGILQRFIEPKGTKNETIRAIWSPKICLLERHENIYQLHDHRFGLYERCITYEGPEFYSTSSPIRGLVLAGQIQRVCESIISHISEVTFGQITISRIVLNFKVDSRDKLWLLHTTSIRTIPQGSNTAPMSFTNSIPNSSKTTLPAKKTLLNIDSTVSIPSHIHLNSSKSHSLLDNDNKPKEREAMQLCLSCGTETVESLRHAITYKSIIKHFDHVLELMHIAGGSTIDRQGSSMGHSITSSPQAPGHWPPNHEIIEAAGGVGFGCLEILYENRSPSKKRSVNSAETALEVSIPPIIRCLHPKLVWKSYSKCRNDPLFLYKNVNVCESCYLVYAEFLTMLLRLDGNLNALLGPEPSTAPSTFQSRQESSPSGADGAVAGRPRSADWRAMSALHRSRSDSTVPNDSSDWKGSSTGGFHEHIRRPPALPQAIRRGEDATLVSKQVTQGSTTGLTGEASGLDRGSSKFSLYDPEDIRTMVQEREKHFFREVAKNPNLRNQHPLMHLITTQKKLSIAEQQSGLIMTMASSKASGDSLFASQYGQSAPVSDMKNRFATYKKELKVNDENLVTETRRSKATSLKQGSHSKLMSTGASAATSEASKAHMEYLRGVLSRLEEEVEPLKKTDG